MIRDAIFAPHRASLSSHLTIAIVIAVLLQAAPLTAQESAHKQDAKTIAGRTVEEFADQLESDDRVVRLIAVKSLGAFGQSAGDPLRKALDHDDPAMRYTAAVHLGLIGEEALKKAIERLEKLAADDAPLTDRMSAAFALCQSGQVDKYLPKLIEAAQDPERGTACSAAELIGFIGPPAKAAIEPLQKLHEENKPGAKGGDYHIGGATKNALRKINNES